MCGICGFNFENKKLIKLMTNSLERRGPDDEGYYLDKNISLGHRRLSIIDLKTGKQSISNEKGNLQIIFNGEIYNFKELRKDLEKKRHKFSTESDTEVIIHLYEEYKEDCPKYLQGMFAFAIWDNKEKKLFLARDRLGIKPLLYYNKGDKFIFASEIKAILKDPEIKREINKESLYHYLTFNYVPTPATILNNISKLPPASTLTYHKNKISINSYWDVNISETNMSEDFAIKQITNLLKDSIKSRMISDVPLGAFLSGGVDSSFVVGLMSQLSEQPIKTFSIGFPEEEYNELKYAKIIADKFQTDHKTFNVTPDINIISKLVEALDEPFADPSAIPCYYVSKMASKNVKVVLSGEGGDELFAGYSRYLPWKQDKFANLTKIIPFKNKLASISLKLGKEELSRKINKAKQLANASDSEKFLSKVCKYSEDEKKNILTEKYNLNSESIINNYFNKPASLLNKQLYTDVKTFLVDNNLFKTDRTSMANSLELRVPILDHRLAEFAFKIPSKLKLKNKTFKYIFKKAANQIIPKEIINRKKKGFAAPLPILFRNNLKDFMYDILNSDSFKNRGLFDQNYLNKLINQHLTKKRDHTYRLWTLIMFELWLRKFIDNSN